MTFEVTSLKRGVNENLITSATQLHDTRGPFLPFLFRAFTIWASPMSRKKILSRDEMIAERARLRASGKSLVFTNGVFDILHVGHVRYLAEARTLGDALLVAVNSDDSVRELKGAIGRSILKTSARKSWRRSRRSAT